MAGWVIVTIRIKHLHKVHNIFVAYVMAMDIMLVVIFTLLSGIMMIGYSTGVVHIGLSTQSSARILLHQGNGAER